jgi:hypothetical protein
MTPDKSNARATAAIFVAAAWNCGRNDPIAGFSNSLPLSAKACVKKLATRRFLRWYKHFRCMIYSSTKIPMKNISS